MKISRKKTEFMVCSTDPENNNIKKDDDVLKQVPKSKHLGSICTEDGKLNKTCCMLFLEVIPRCLKFICRRFGTFCLFHLHRQVDASGKDAFHSHLPACEDGTECSETSAYKLQTPGYYPKESIQHIALNLITLTHSLP